ncbi:hypothetical protein E2C01_099295 [Portunus trituberculatus]|uniref:Uncharacterized protein n=1 Tax=Portunus trituberculatus TaxID=210409 RepID=A0A5B7K552_PORTR|nr:hypothetical protein [Portunus trituberculatus]
MGKDVARIRQVAWVIGFLVAATSVVLLGKLHYRHLETAKINALHTAQGNFDAMMIISENMKSELAWSCSNAAVQDRAIFRSGLDIVIFKDASTVPPENSGEESQGVDRGSFSDVTALDGHASMHAHRSSAAHTEIKVHSDIRHQPNAIPS